MVLLRIIPHLQAIGIKKLLLQEFFNIFYILIMDYVSSRSRTRVYLSDFNSVDARCSCVKYAGQITSVPFSDFTDLFWNLKFESMKKI